MARHVQREQLAFLVSLTKKNVWPAPDHLICDASSYISTNLRSLLFPNWFMLHFVFCSETQFLCNGIKNAETFQFECFISKIWKSFFIFFNFHGQIASEICFENCFWFHWQHSLLLCRLNCKKYRKQKTKTRDQNFFGFNFF